MANRVFIGWGVCGLILAWQGWAPGDELSETFAEAEAPVAAELAPPAVWGIAPHERDPIGAPWPQPACDARRANRRPPHGPTLLGAGVVFLGRTAGDIQIPIMSGGTMFPQADLSHGFQPGFRARIGLPIKTFCRLELSYLAVDQWSADEQSDNLRPDAGPGTLARDDLYDADLNDVQINLVSDHPYRDWNVMFGFRAISTGDSLNSAFRFNDGLGGLFSERVVAETSNTLLGLQVGSDMVWKFDRLLFRGEIRGGVLNNHSEQSGIYFDEVVVVDGVSEPSFQIDDDQVSFMGELRSELQYPLTANISFRLGYQGILLSDILQVAEQFRDGVGGPAHPTGLGLHGVYAGLEGRY